MDVHKESISIAVMNSVGKVVMESVIETKASMILQFIEGLRGDVQVTFVRLVARNDQRGDARGCRPHVLDWRLHGYKDKKGDTPASRCPRAHCDYAHRRSPRSRVGRSSQARSAVASQHFGVKWIWRPDYLTLNRSLTWPRIGFWVSGEALFERFRG
jgi:hypothetical protein